MSGFVPACEPSGCTGSDHGKVDHAEDTPDALIRIVDAHMWRILAVGEDPVEVIAELQYELIESPSQETAESAGRLYLLFADLGDIVDGWPVDYGTATEMVAQREIRDAARDWLEAVRTADDVPLYLERWVARSMALPASEGGRLVFRRQRED
jgi:hypothetical protein